MCRVPPVPSNLGALWGAPRIQARTSSDREPVLRVVDEFYEFYEFVKRRCLAHHL